LLGASTLADLCKKVQQLIDDGMELQSLEFVSQIEVEFIRVKGALQEKRACG